MKELANRKLSSFLVILSLLDVTIYFVSRSKTYFDFLLWNLFLAWIPLILSSLAVAANKRISGKSKPPLLLVLFGIAWLLFFPNAPYVITDLMHLTARRSAYLVHGKLQFEFWHDLMIVIFFAWTSLLLGAVSMYHIQYAVRLLTNTFVSWCFVVAASALGGYGILLGREYRLNSWDVLGAWGQVSEIVKESFLVHFASKSK